MVRKPFRKHQLRRTIPLGDDNIKRGLKKIGPIDVVCVQLALYRNDCGHVAV
jgi:hypothetical protein